MWSEDLKSIGSEPYLTHSMSGRLREMKLVGLKKGGTTSFRNYRLVNIENCLVWCHSLSFHCEIQKCRYVSTKKEAQNDEKPEIPIFELLSS